MKLRVLAFLASAFISVGFTQNVQKVKLDELQTVLRITDNDYSGIRISSSLSEIVIGHENSKKGIFVSLSGEYLAKTYNPGHPDLPVISRLIEVPHGASVSFRIVGFTEEIIDLNKKGFAHKVMPAQPSVSKSDDPENVPFFFDEKIYKTDRFLNEEVAIYEEVGFMRATRLGRVEIRPIQYNPVTNTLKILNNLEVEVLFNGADRSITDEQHKKYASPMFQTSLGLVNRLTKSKALPTNTPITYVIVSDPMFEEILQPFIEWKRLKGFHVVEAYTNNSAVGTTTTSIKSYLQNLYENPEEGVNPPTFALLVGDVNQIPAFSGTATEGAHVSDLYYFEYTGDRIPELYYGRFSAENTAQLQPQIDKTLEYEKYLMADPSYLTNHVLIAGVDASFAPVYGNGHIRYAHGNYSNESNGINPYTYLYNNAAESTTGIASNQSEASAHIRNKISEGIGWANYTAHCGPTSWSDPSFTTSHIPTLTNEGKYGVWIGNCCQSNSFNAPVCLGEAALRAENKGAIGYIGGSNNTYWDEDYYYGVGVGSPVTNPVYANFGPGVYDAVFHTQTNEIDDPSKWYITQGQFNMAGNLAVETSASSRKRYYWEIYHLMGDPSLVPYLYVPRELDVTLTPNVIILGNSTLNISTAPHSYVALSQDGVLISTGITNPEGSIDLEFEPTAILPGEAVLVITAQNHQPYIENIVVSPANEPYVVLKSFSTSSSPDYGTEVDIDIVLKNISGEPYTATDVVAVLTSGNEYVSITNSTANIGTIAWGQEANSSSAFTFSIANNVPDQTPMIFTLSISGKYNGESYAWSQHFTIKANAPAFRVGEITISDNNEGIPGILDPGETADAIIVITNIGHADAFDITSELKSLSEHVTVNGSTFTAESLEAGSSVNAVFSITAAADAPLETYSQFSLDIESGEYSHSEEVGITIGAIPVYIMGSEASVTGCIGRFYDSGGASSNYSDNESSTITFFPATEGNMLHFFFTSFSTEPDWDYLYVYDGANTSASQIDGSPFAGNNSPGSFFATNEQGAITFRFASDNSVNHAGWSAEFSCFDPSEVPTCASNPSPAINQVVTIEPVTLQWANVAGAFEYDVYINKTALPNSATSTLSTNLFEYKPEPNENYFWKVVPKNNAGSAEGCPVWHFSTGELTSILRMGNGTISTCSAKLYDTGGANDNYSNNENLVLTLKPSDPEKKITITFSEFSIEADWDFLYIYDGSSVTAPLIGTFTGSESPQKVYATNSEGSLTLKFTSDGSQTQSGWAADVACENPSYLVTFEVVNPNQVPVVGAVVNLDGYSSRSTNSSGIAVIQGVFPQSQIPYTITTTSFNLASGTIDVTDENVYQKVVLVPVTSPSTMVDELNIFPNPFEGTFTITGSGRMERVVISTIIGQECASIATSGQNEYVVSLQNLPSGVYLVTVHFLNGDKSIRKVIKK